MSTTMIISIISIVISLVNIINCTIFLYQWHKK